METHLQRFRPWLIGIGGLFYSTLTVLLFGSAVTLAQPPFMRNMHSGPVVMPHVEPRIPVENTIAIDGQRHRDRLESRDLANPIPNTPAALEQGAWLYSVYCTVCHGANGQGDGQIASHFRRMPNLSAAHVQNYTDGWVYSIIREGGFAMPPFADSMSEPEQWALVHFVKTLTHTNVP